MSNKIAVFDLCGTLFKSNTTFDFIVFFHLKRNNSVKYLFSVLMRGWLGKGLHKFFKVDVKSRLVSTLRNEKKADIEEIACDFYDEFLNYKWCKQAHELFVYYKNCSDVFIASSSINPVVECVAKKHNVACISSLISYEKNICLGVVRSDLTGKKHLNFTQLEFVATDNLTDLKLLSLAKKATVFSKKRHLKKWAKIIKGIEVEVEIVIV